MTAQLVYIGGYGRSGSTILDVLLDQLPGVFGAGELTWLFEDLADDERCSCGDSLRTCAFWSEVVDGLDLEAQGTVGFDAASRLTRRIETRGGTPDEESRYEALWGAVLERIRQTSGADIVVDSSKSARKTRRRLEALARADKAADTRVIHMLRHPASVMESNWRGDNRLLERGRTKRVGHFRTALGWVTANDRVAVDSTASELLRLRYEDLVADSRPALERVGQFLGVDPSPAIEAAVTGTELHPGHGVRGNRLRRSKTLQFAPAATSPQKAPSRRLMLADRLVAERRRALGYGGGVEDRTARTSDGDRPGTTSSPPLGRAWRRVMTLGVSYLIERLLPLVTILLPAAWGLSGQRLGDLELLVTASALGVAVGPLGTPLNVMLPEYRSWDITRFALSIGWLGSAVLGGIVAAFVLEPTWVILTMLVAASAASFRITKHRLLVEQTLTLLFWSAVLSAAVYGLVVLVGSGGGPVRGWVFPLALAGGTAAGALVGTLRLRDQSRLSGANSSDQLSAEDRGRSKRQFLAHSVTLTVPALAAWLVDSADRFVLDIFVARTEVGMYGLAYRSAMLVSGVASVLVLWWRSEAMSAGLSWSAANYRRWVGRIATGIGLLALLSALPLSLILRSVLDRDLAELAWIVAPVLIAAVSMIGVTAAMDIFILADRRSLVALYWGAFAALNLALNFALIPLLGTAGAALATGLGSTLVGVTAGLHADRLGRKSAEAVPG